MLDDADLNRKCAEAMGWALTEHMGQPGRWMRYEAVGGPFGQAIWEGESIFEYVPDYANNWSCVPEMLAWLTERGHVSIYSSGNEWFVEWANPVLVNASMFECGGLQAEWRDESLPLAIASVVVAVHEAREGAES